MKKNQFKISSKMAVQKNNLPEWTWDEIIILGLYVANVITNVDNLIKYKKLY